MALLVDIEKKLGDFQLKVQLQSGDETLAFLGASGCGKSMTLKCIAGIEKPDQGRIVVDDITLFDSERNINLSPQKRRTGLMFQNYALFPNMTVLQNVQVGAKREKNAEQRQKAVNEMIERFELSQFVEHFPAQLSGGQQQRVALARILVSQPRILLLDEPFSALDSHLRFRLQQELCQTIRSFKKSVVLVSHDRDEVFRLSDSIAIISNGRIEKYGAKADVFRDPGTVRGAILTGCKNISRAKPLDKRRISALDWGIELDAAADTTAVDFLGIRMHDIQIVSEAKPNTFCCRVVEEIENPFSFTIMLMPEQTQSGIALGIELGKAIWHRLQAERLTIHIPPESLLLLKK